MSELRVWELPLTERTALIAEAATLGKAYTHALTEQMARQAGSVADYDRLIAADKEATK